MKTIEHIDLVIEAKRRAQDIVKALEDCAPSKYVALYINENGGYTLSTIQKNWDTRTPKISFGGMPKPLEVVNEIIEDYDNFSC